ncbi:hypothetical protein KY290_037338 [Solanum tuberosum]|uniref:Uncharacterized protein n=1 Tax=Solanum tuberosum TaxID=4113 RepID=A0ABQ7TX75_SOLTU|nr:hypothetical protein KY285_036636 [Solanum tuberosum]KAH0738633.1 hypothetical protein KY290_037338 [Solanum tuberosum]
MPKSQVEVGVGVKVMVESQVEVMANSWIGVSGWRRSQVSGLRSGSGVSHNVESQVGVGVLSQGWGRLGLGTGSGLESLGWVSGRVPRSGTKSQVGVKVSSHRSGVKVRVESQVEVGCQVSMLRSRSCIEVEVKSVTISGRGQVSGWGLVGSRVDVGVGIGSRIECRG